VPHALLSKIRRLAGIVALVVCFHSIATSVPGPVPAGTGRPPVSRSREPGDGGPQEYRIKAAFLFNFVRFTKWPDSALGKKEDPITILVVGKDRFGDHLTKTFKDKQLHERDVVISHVKEVPKEPKAHLIFASALTHKDELKLIERCEGKPVLLVGDHSGFAKLGACANFYLDEKHVRFDVNTDELKRAKLTMSSQILKLANIVKTERREQE
jgi:uncharacterized protein DUF4154